jgi:hypothetical protein
MRMLGLPGAFYIIWEDCDFGVMKLLCSFITPKSQ